MSQHVPAHLLDLVVDVAHLGTYEKAWENPSFSHHLMIFPSFPPGLHLPRPMAPALPACWVSSAPPWARPWRGAGRGCAGGPTVAMAAAAMAAAMAAVCLPKNKQMLGKIHRNAIREILEVE